MTCVKTTQTLANDAAAEHDKWHRIRVHVITNVTQARGPGPKEKRRIQPESTPELQIRGHLWYKLIQTV